MRSKTRTSRRTLLRNALTFIIGVLVFSGVAQSEPRTITVASTTSTQNSGLFEWLLPQFTDATGIEVQVVAVGTGQAIRIATNGDADLLLGPCALQVNNTLFRVALVTTVGIALHQGVERLERIVD